MAGADRPSARADDTHARLAACMLALEEQAHLYEFDDLAAHCGLGLTGTSLARAGGVAGKVVLLQPDDGPEPDDVLGLAIIPAGEPCGRAVLSTRSRAISDEELDDNAAYVLRRFTEDAGGGLPELGHSGASMCDASTVTTPGVQYASFLSFRTTLSCRPRQLVDPSGD